MATTHEEKTRKGQSYIGAYVPKELADRIDRIALSYRRSEFVRRALEREASRMEAAAVSAQVEAVDAGLKKLRLKHGH